MTTIDSVKIVLPADVCSPLTSKLDKHRVTLRNGDNDVYFDAKNVITGLKYIRYRPATNDVIIELSAKILQSDYKRLISLDTIEQVSDRLSDTGIIKLHIADLIECGNVLKIDYCNNLQVGNVDTFLAAINAISSPMFIKRPYSGKGKLQSVVFTGILKTINDRLTCYNKFIESKDLTFMGTLRVECNITDLKGIRRATGYTNNFTDCLTVKDSPTLALFKKILSDNKLSNEFMTKVLNKDIDLLKALQFDTLLNECGNDMQTAVIALKTHYSKSTAYRYIKQLEQYSRIKLTAENDYQRCIMTVQNMLSDSHLN